MTKGIIQRINWEQIVQEAIIRRNTEKLTQKMHAALAGVSIPTMISFEKAETSISIEKVLAILNVVGMVEREKPVINPRLVKIQELEVNIHHHQTTLDNLLITDEISKKRFKEGIQERAVYRFEVQEMLEYNINQLNQLKQEKQQ